MIIDVTSLIKDVTIAIKDVTTLISITITLIAVAATFRFAASVFMQCGVLWVVADAIKKTEVTAFKSAVTSVMV